MLFVVSPPQSLTLKKIYQNLGWNLLCLRCHSSPSRVMEAKQLLRWLSRLTVPHALLQTSGSCSATWQHKPVIIPHFYVFPKSRPCHRKAEHCLTQSLAFGPHLNSTEPWTWAGGNRAALSLEMAPSCSSGLVWSPVKLLRAASPPSHTLCLRRFCRLFPSLFLLFSLRASISAKLAAVLKAPCWAGGWAKGLHEDPRGAEETLGTCVGRVLSYHCVWSTKYPSYGLVWGIPEGILGGKGSRYIACALRQSVPEPIEPLWTGV